MKKLIAGIALGVGSIGAIIGALSTHFERQGDPLNYMVKEPIFYRGDQNSADSQPVRELSLKSNEFVGKPVSFMMSLRYKGPITSEAVNTIVKNKMAESLEMRLLGQYAANIAEKTKQYDETIHLLSRSINEEIGSARKALDSRRENIFVIDGQAETRFQQEHAFEEAKRKAGQNNYIVSNTTKNQISTIYLIKRADFPSLFQALKTRVMVVKARNLAIRDSVECLIAEKGASIFK